MTIQEVVKNITDRIQTTANVKTIYGEPITADGKTIIPVARVRYGFGVGGGSQAPESPSEDGERPQESAGGGGGGGVEVTPVGFIEITAGETRFVSFEDKRRIIRAVVIGLLLGLFLLRKRRRS